MVCIKCGASTKCSLWHKDGTKCPAGSQENRADEHLHYFCSCGYDWTADIVSDDVLEARFTGYSDGKD